MNRKRCCLVVDAAGIVLHFDVPHPFSSSHPSTAAQTLFLPASASTTKMIDQRIFEDLQNKIDEEVQVREVNPPLSALCRVVNSSRAKPASKQSR